MKQEFATVYGKSIVERNTLFIRSMYLPFGKTAFARIGYELLLIVIFAFQFFSEDKLKRTVGILIVGLMIVFRLPNFYDTFLKRSYATRIPFERIKSFTTEDDHYGLQTIVTLYLKNGRYKKILFRKLEHQVEPFTELLSQHTIQTQFA